MKIFLHEITDQEMELDFDQSEPWVTHAVENVDEKVDEGFRTALNKAPEAARPTKVHYSLRKVDEVVVVNGKIKTHLKLVCSRCANPFDFTCNLNFSGLFCKDPVMAGVAHREAGKPMGQNKGFARHAHDTSADEAAAQGKDLDITYLSQDFIDLSDVLTEQLQLQVPFQPLCSDDCKGICTICGTDLNTGRCACAKVAKTNPFSVLKDIKL